ncbi:hypothetical protein M6B38_381590 [Iris pallida]|uniref:Uncharacterized protein n=1 Tax=Iris pallida TaxID=29817 RepID=A0AAX6G7D6_IRIPA|nr:hypothetical protein M6B38_381590 [Iris pallida]
MSHRGSSMARQAGILVMFFLSLKSLFKEPTVDGGVYLCIILSDRVAPYRCR